MPLSVGTNSLAYSEPLNYASDGISLGIARSSESCDGREICLEPAATIGPSISQTTREGSHCSSGAIATSATPPGDQEPQSVVWTPSDSETEFGEAQQPLPQQRPPEPYSGASCCAPWTSTEVNSRSAKCLLCASFSYNLSSLGDSSTLPHRSLCSKLGFELAQRSRDDD